jgi:LEA14-like dessication related protein
MKSSRNEMPNGNVFFVRKLTSKIDFDLILLRSRVVLLFSLIGTLVFLSGCEFKDVQLERVEGFEIKKVKDGDMEAVISVVLDNPNSFPITVKFGKFDLSVGKNHIGDASLSESFKIQANSKESYDIEIDGTIGDLVAVGISGLAGLLTGKQPEVTIKGELKAGNFFYTKKVPVELKTNVPLNL